MIPCKAVPEGTIDELMDSEEVVMTGGTKMNPSPESTSIPCCSPRAPPIAEESEISRWFLGESTCLASVRYEIRVLGTFSKPYHSHSYVIRDFPLK